MWFEVGSRHVNTRASLLPLACVLRSQTGTPLKYLLQSAVSSTVPLTVVCTVVIISGSCRFLVCTWQHQLRPTVQPFDKQKPGENSHKSPDRARRQYRVVSSTFLLKNHKQFEFDLPKLGKVHFVKYIWYKCLRNSFTTVE